MKAEILKIAKCKDGASFYKKYPTEEAFMKVHGKEFKKAQQGAAIMASFGQTPKQGLGYTPGQNSGMPTQLGYNLSGNATGQQFGFNGYPLNGVSTQQTITGQTSVDATKGLGKGGGLGEMAALTNLPGQIAKGIKDIKAEKAARKNAEMWEKVSKVNLDASRSTDVDINRQLADNMTKKREAMMPVNTGEEFFPIYGVGTNALAKNGKALKNKVGGNPTEIQNTYAPKTLYTDLGYAQAGATIPGADIFGQATSMAYGDNAGSQLGGSLGGAVGSIFGPVGSVIGGEIGKFAGYALDQNPDKMRRARENTQKNVGMMATNNWGKSLQQQNSGYMEDGGWVSHDWLPQVITNFGNHTMKSLMKPDPTMDTLRAGGHLQRYTAPSEQAMQTMTMGGDLQTHWGGHAETMSQNPYLPEGGETVMFRGNSHEESDGRGNTGIGVTYGQSPVEVERGEPAVKLQDGGSLDSNLVVFGNLKIPNEYTPILGDDKAKGMKFKNYIADLSKTEVKQNKIINRASIVVNELDPNSAFKKLTLASQQANILGANMTLKNIAGKKQKAADLQQAIKDVADDNGYDVDALAKGKIEYAKLGTTLSKAQDGYKSKYGITPWEGNKSGYGKGDKTKSSFTAKEWDDVADKLGFKGKGNKAFQEFLVTNPASKDIVKKRHQELYGKDPFIDDKLGYGWAADELKNSAPSSELLKPRGGQSVTLSPKFEPKLAPITPYDGPVEVEKNGFPWQQAMNEVLPYLRPSDSDTLDPRQLTGEMYALSNNQQEPVYAQGFNPQLTVPYDISMQDVLNKNQADFRAAQRTMGYNPAAQANLAAQQYQANQGVLGDQFRANQEMQNKTYAQNRQALDQAQMTNLGIFSQQADKQSQAKSNTKAQTQAALQSISAKMLENEAKNKELKTYENLYNYRFGNDQKAQNWNPLAQWNMQGSGTTRGGLKGLPEDSEYLFNDKGEPVDIRKISKKDKQVTKNGSIVKLFK